MLNVCGGDSHWRAEEEGEVEKVMRKEERVLSLGRESERWVPLIGSGEEEREKGRGESVEGQRIWWMERERVSRESEPE